MKIKKITYFPIENLFFKPISAHNRLTLYAGVNAILAGIGIWTILRQSSVVLPLDDAYITVHNAQVLLSGRDQNFADAPALLGATSPVHLLFVTGLLPLFGPIVASMIASWFAIMLYATGLARLTFLHGGSIFLAVLVIALGLLAGYAPYQLVNGLETGLAMASVTWALVFASAEQPSRKLALICGLLPFIRPELAILAALLMLRQLGIRWLRREGNFLIVADILLTTGVAAPFVIWSYCSLGALIPSAAAAKEAFFAESFLSSPVKLAWICVGLTQSGILPLGIGLILFKSRLRLIFFAFHRDVHSELLSEVSGWIIA